jgi:hypothetical protein
MEKTKEENLRLTERELRAIQLACEQGVVTAEQLWHAVWKGQKQVTKNYTYKRLKRLLKCQVLDAYKSPINRRLYFAAAPLGRLHLEAARGIRAPEYIPPSIQFRHAERLTDIRLAIERAGRLASWATDQMLLIHPSFPRDRFRGYVPDALWVTPTKSRVLVEYERAYKGPARLRQKVEAFSREMARADKFMDHVLWIGEEDRAVELRKVISGDNRHTVRTFSEFEAELARFGVKP